MFSTELERLLARLDIQALSMRLLSKTSLSEADRAALDSVALELGQRLTDCRVERRSLAALEVALNRQLAFASTLLHPIHRLSDDELRLIFMAVASDFRNPFHRAPYFATTICTVSRRWRAVARSTASLWNHLVLRPSRVVISRGLPQRTTPWDHFLYVASLCAWAPLHVRWNCEIHPAPLVEFASAIPNVIRSLDLTAEWSSLPVMASSVFNRLQHLALTVRGEKDQFLLHHLDSLASLSSFHLYCQYGEAFPPSFTTLSLRGIRNLRFRLIPGPPLDFVVGTLTTCSQLTALDLRFDFPLGIPHKDTPPICLPALLTITLADAACAIVSFLRAPSAITLCLSEVYDVYVHGSLFGAIHGFVTASACTLETLAFYYSYCTADLGDMRLCFSALHTVQYLSVEYSWDEPFAAPFGKAVVDCLRDETRAVLPHLHSIFFRGAPRRGRFDIVAAIEHFRRSRATERHVEGCVVDVVDDFYSDIVTHE